MFPLDFPSGILARRAAGAKLVFDPFAGRGTTLYAARQRGIRAIGIDCSPVAVAISRAKLADFTTEGPLDLAKVLVQDQGHVEVPEGEFWESAFHPETLRDLCRLRAGLLSLEDNDASVVLRATALGVLHGPITKVRSYLSNQMQRTFSPKPNYAVRFWKRHALEPPRASVLGALRRKLDLMAKGVYRTIEDGWRDVHLGDSSNSKSYRGLPPSVDTVITSPPYYGMRTYVSDQWLRHWFLGGPDDVDYTTSGDLPSSSQDDFSIALGRTWTNLGAVAPEGLRLFVRFGTIPSRRTNPRKLLLSSLEASSLSWHVVSIRNARNATAGKRQADQMCGSSKAIDELDLHAVLS
ncbi:MAG: site-specific DNA-methyltransferase [Holophagales bacterium]|nr:site-specific DNA-methyltransferase [Holophagales bacterium]MYG30690.1 site-specific DNA-methyltransferase [Holophagales bacterium]MYI81630.1 site-specific DNA-methyltransferase [Holophagales bacterium]